MNELPHRLTLSDDFWRASNAIFEHLYEIGTSEEHLDELRDGDEEQLARAKKEALELWRLAEMADSHWRAVDTARQEAGLPPYRRQP